MDSYLDNCWPNTVNNSTSISSSISTHASQLRDDKASRVNNFLLLLETLSALRVTYDANTAFKIINRQLGVAKKLLY